MQARARREPDTVHLSCTELTNEWMTLVHTGGSAKDVQDLFVKGQFLNSCQEDLAAQFLEGN